MAEEDDTRRLDELTPAERERRAQRRGCVPAWRFKALVRALILKGVITQKDLDNADAG